MFDNFVLVVTLVAYLFPAIVAFGRGHHNAAAIAILNITLGWTGLGWLGALIWASTAVRPPPAEADY